MITALYDCRSKQEYIYRTNKIREISGASLLLSDVYGLFIARAEKQGIHIKNAWRDDVVNGTDFSPDSFAASGYDGEVIYEGGGNLYILYKDRAVYVRANQIFSRMLLEETYSISIITACVETTDNFNNDRRELYLEKNRLKNQGTYSVPCTVLPLTQTDRMTFMPVAEKVKEHDIPVSRTAEAQHKRDAYERYFQRKDELSTEVLDSLVLERYVDSLLAIIYIDGNDMGNKIKACTENKNDYSDCVRALREFSIHTEEYFVQKPLLAIEDCLRKKNDAEAELIRTNPMKAHKYRKIIGGGDEITIICRSSDAMDVVRAYFDALQKTTPLAEGIPNSSCAGIAIFHSHAPFADVYQIAESCCESGKKKTRENGSRDNCIDFHYCHSGITNELDVIREEQEQRFTARPYRLDEFEAWIRTGNTIREIGRSNVKALGEAIVKGESFYRIELERIKSRFRGRFKELIDRTSNSAEAQKLQRMIYDISVVYDTWFAGGGEADVQDAN